MLDNQPNIEFEANFGGSLMFFKSPVIGKALAGRTGVSLSILLSNGSTSLLTFQIKTAPFSFWRLLFLWQDVNKNELVRF